MIALLGCQLIGCWRIAEADLWHRDHLGLGGLGGLDILKAKRDLFFNSLLVGVFGEACVHQGVHIFKSKGVEVGEIDVLVVFGDRAIVLQAKSKRLTLEARKGNDLQLQDDFKKAVRNSCDQALSCAEALGDATYTLRDAGGELLILARPLKQVFPMCVVADHYPALAFQAQQFLKFKTPTAYADRW